MPDAMRDALLLDELLVVSDLHLGGEEGFQIFASGRELAWLAHSVAAPRNDPAARVALLVNGDFIDFLAEEDALAFDPAGATAKLDNIMRRPAFAPVFDAFRALLATPQRLLVINLGNHDLELALPWVRRHLAEALTRGDATAASRLLLVTDGAGFACQVGASSVMCLHGNEVDSWNVTDHERLRRYGRDMQLGLDPGPWAPNAGSQLVVQAMNQVKRRYPFVDLLKPETTAVAPILAALQPSLLGKVEQVIAASARSVFDAVRMGTGFLDAEGMAGATPYTPGNAPRMVPASRPGADDLLRRAEQAYLDLDGGDPVSLVRDQQGAQLGTWGAIRAALQGKSTAQVLREKLDFLDKDQSFDPFAPDDTFKAIDAWVSPDIDIVLTGHTHLERALRRRNGGLYYNSGTWARLMCIPSALRQSEPRFQALFDQLDKTSIETLEASLPEVVLRRNTVVRVWREADGSTQAELHHVLADTAPPHDIRSQPVPGSRQSPHQATGRKP